PAGRVAGDHRRGLGLAIALQQRQAKRDEERSDLRIERGAARHPGLEPAAEALAQLAADREAGDQVEKALRRGEAARPLEALAAKRNRQVEQPAARPGGLRQPALDAL